METTAIIVKTPMIIPSSVRKVLNLFDHREPMAMETDSLILTLAIDLLNILYYMIRKREAKVFRIHRPLTTLCQENKMGKA